jgi:NADH:ubiquinone oxidoreductase subunit 6 (subunit J)
MTLSIKLSEIKADSLHYFPFLVLVMLIFLLNVVVLTSVEFEPIMVSLTDLFVVDSYITSISFNDYALSVTKLSNVKTVGSVLFSETSFHFVFIGMVLLFAMIATIILTLQKNFMSKTQNAFIQVLREFNTTVFFYS